MNVTELAPGLWRWTAPHPDWKESDDWEQEVGCTYYEAPAMTVLIDPLVAPERDRFFEALDRDVERRGLPVAILLTVPWHERSCGRARRALRERERRRRTAWSRLPCPRSTRRCGGCRSTRRSWPATCSSARAESIEVCPDSWLDERSSHTSVRAALVPLLELPIERIIVSHGKPVLEDGRAALARALR